MDDADHGARRAALLLHGLPSAQRELVLSRLEAASRQRLMDLLSEVATLGLPAPLARSLAASTPAGGPLPTPVAEMTPTERLERYDGARIAEVLVSCAPQTIAAILSMRSWTWEAQALAALPVELRVRTEAARERGGPVWPPDVSRRLCEHLLARLGATPRVSSVTRRGWWGRWSWPS